MADDYTGSEAPSQGTSAAFPRALERASFEQGILTDESVRERRPPQQLDGWFRHYMAARGGRRSAP